MVDSAQCPAVILQRIKKQNRIIISTLHKWTVVKYKFMVSLTHNNISCVYFFPRLSVPQFKKTEVTTIFKAY